MRSMVFAVLSLGVLLTCAQHGASFETRGWVSGVWYGCQPCPSAGGLIYAGPGTGQPGGQGPEVIGGEFSGSVVYVSARDSQRCEILCSAITRPYLDQRLSLFRVAPDRGYTGELRVVYTSGNRLVANCIGFEPRVGDRVAATVISNRSTIDVLELIEGRRSLARVTSIDPATSIATARCHVADMSMVGLKFVCFRGKERSYLGMASMKCVERATNRIAVESHGFDLRVGDYVIIFDVLDHFVAHGGLDSTFRSNWRVLASGQIHVTGSEQLRETRSWNLRNGKSLEASFASFADRWVRLTGTAGTRGYAFEQFQQDSLQFAALRDPSFALVYTNWLREQDKAIDLFGSFHVWLTPPIAPSNKGPLERIAAYVHTIGPDSVVFEEGNNRDPAEFPYTELRDEIRNRILAAVPELRLVPPSQAPAGERPSALAPQDRRASEKEFQAKLREMQRTNGFAARPPAMLQRHLDRKAFAPPQRDPAANVALQLRTLNPRN